jgi:hypothetical protein
MMWRMIKNRLSSRRWEPVQSGSYPPPNSENHADAEIDLLATRIHIPCNRSKLGSDEGFQRGRTVTKTGRTDSISITLPEESIRTILIGLDRSTAILVSIPMARRSPTVTRRV